MAYDTRSLCIGSLKLACRRCRLVVGSRAAPHGHAVHADVNAALNILLRGLGALGVKASPPSQVRVLSFLPTPSGVVEKKRNP